MAIKVFSPAVQVLLQKQIRRKDGVAERYAPADVIDLTQFLGDSSSVRTQKSLHQPMGGFTVSFADKIEPKVLDTVYALVEPMDIVEIRAAREPHKYAGKKLPLIMRGFVSSVERAEQMGPEGTPQRVVAIQGQDAGKIWAITRLNFRVALLTGTPLLEKYAFQVATGTKISVLPVSDFMRELVIWVNMHVNRMAAYSERQAVPFRAMCTVPEGQVAPEIPAPIQGPAWQFAETFAERAWNELWIEDSEDAALLHFRPLPYKDLDGKFIMPGASVDASIEMEQAEVVALSMNRSDKRIANVFWTEPGNSSLDVNAWVSIAAYQAGKPLDFSYQNNRPELYGYRVMQSPTMLLTNALATVPSTQDNASRADVDKQVQWYVHRGDQLKELNRDNGVLEEGQMTVRGDEKLKVGRYLRLTRGDVVSEAYLTGVAHNFQPLSTWTTALMVERGTGFLTRIKAEKSPYWREGREGAMP